MAVMIELSSACTEVNLVIAAYIVVTPVELCAFLVSYEWSPVAI